MANLLAEPGSFILGQLSSTRTTYLSIPFVIELLSSGNHKENLWKMRGSNEAAALMFWRSSLLRDGKRMMAGANGFLIKVYLHFL